MASDSFVHLHLHTQYSLLDGAIRFDDLIEKAKQYNMPAVAITDHGNMFGAAEFYLKCKKAGVKPIIGCELYLAPESRFSRDSKGISDAAYHLILAVAPPHLKEQQRTEGPERNPSGETVPIPDQRGSADAAQGASA